MPQYLTQIVICLKQGVLKQMVVHAAVTPTVPSAASAKILRMGNASEVSAVGRWQRAEG